ncbi:MAG: alpha-L-rhamnosidase C-terminal domain-containing protein [Bacteroidota bacterium]
MNNLILIISLIILASSCKNRQHDVNDSYGQLLKNSIIWQRGNVNILNEPLSVGFRKQVEIITNPKKAEIMIFADSRYVLWINGKYIERGPCRFDPKGPRYDMIDIKDHIHKGQNTIAIMVQGNVTGSLKVMKHIPGLTALLKTDNRQYITDSTWLCSNQIPQQMIRDIWTWSCILDKVDANTKDYNWQTAQFDDSNWEPAVPVSGESWGPLTIRSIPLLRETDLGSGTILQVKNGKTTDTSVKRLPDHLPVKFEAGDEIVIDAGKLSLTYWIINMNAGKGTDLVFTPCQDFVKGETIINYNCITTYKAREGNQAYMSNETFGFRYLNIKVLNGSFTLDSIRFISRLYPNIQIAEFECNDDFLNKTWQQSCYTAEVLCEDGYVDSAERAEWMGDVGMIQYPVSRMVISGHGEGRNKILYSDPRLMRNMLIHTAQSQQNDGRLKAHHPSDRMDLHWYIEDYSCLWAQGLMQYYENTADKKFGEELWPVLQSQMKWFIDRKNKSGLFTAREFLLHLDNPLRYQVCQGATINAFIYKALIDASYLAKELGRNKESDSYKQEAGSLKSAYNNLMWDEITKSFYSAVYYPEFSQDDKIPELKPVPIEDPASASKVWNDGNVQWIEKGEKVPPTVQAALVALNKGIVSEEHKNDVKKYLLTHSGELKNPYTHLMLFDELYKYDQDSLDVKVLEIIRTRWKSMVSRVSPGTSTESFETQGYLCHPFGLIPAYSLPGYVLGVRKPEPVWKRTILIEPRLGDLLFARGVGLTELGPVPVEWKKEAGDTLKFRFEIPGNAKAVIRLPKQGKQNQIILNGRPVHFTVDGRFLEFRVKSGKYTGVVSKI